MTNPDEPWDFEAEPQMPVIFLSGPMTGFKNYNFPAFDSAKVRLENLGFNVISPADIDRAYGFDPQVLGKDKFDTSPHHMAAVLSRDLSAVASCDFIYMMDGWQESKGANIEFNFSRIIGIPTFYEEDNDTYMKAEMKNARS